MTIQPSATRHTEPDLPGGSSLPSDWKDQAPTTHPRHNLSSAAFFIALAAVLMGSLIVRLLGVSYDYPFLLEVDEQTVLRVTVHMLAAHSVDPHFYYYGPLLVYIQSVWLLPYLLVQWLRGYPGVPSVTSYNSWTATTSDPVMHVYSRIAFVMLGVATVFLAYLVARHLAGRIAGLLAASFLALSPLHSYQSHFYLPNAPTSFFALLTAWFTVLYLESDERGQWSADHRASMGRVGRLLGGESRYLILATIAAALGAAVKYNAVVLLAMPFLAVVLESRSWQATINRGVRLAAIAAATFLVITPPAIFNTISFIHGAGYQFKHYAVLGSADTTPSIIWNGRYLIQHEGLILFPLAIVGLAIMAWRERKHVDVLFLATIVGYYLLLGVQRAHYDRNLLVILPLLDVACAYTLIRVARGWRNYGPWSAAGAAAIILAALGWVTLGQTRALLQPPDQLVARTWLQAHLPPHAHLLADGYTVPPLDRRDIETTFITDVRLSPHQLHGRGIAFTVLSKSLSNYATPAERTSADAVMQPVYRNSSITVFHIRPRGTR